MAYKPESSDARDSVFCASIAETYDRCLGPILFDPYARDLARRVVADVPGPVLEIACGTGILTRAIRSLNGRIPIIATDVSEAMLSYARHRSSALTGIAWERVDAVSLPFGRASFTTLVCQFGLMFFADKHQAVREARRVLKRGGTFLFNVWDCITENPALSVVRRVLSENKSRHLDRFLDVAYGFHCHDEIAQLLDCHGFDDVRVDTLRLAIEARSAGDFAHAIVLGSPIRETIEAQGLDVNAVTLALADALATIGGDEPFRSAMQAIVVEARASAHRRSPR